MTLATGFYANQDEIYYVSSIATYLVASPSFFKNNQWEVSHFPLNARIFDEVLNADVVDKLAGTIASIEAAENVGF